MASDPPSNPDILAQYGIKRDTRSYCTRYFHLAVRVDLLEIAEQQGNFCAVFLHLPTPRLTVWQHLCSIPRRFWSGTFWFHACEEEPLLLTLISTGDESSIVSYADVRDWLQAHCSWNF